MKRSTGSTSGPKKKADAQHRKGFYVMVDSYVTMTDGTGIVYRFAKARVLIRVAAAHFSGDGDFS